MGVFNRIGSLFRANVNDLISQSEAPDKMMNQAITDMAYQLIEARKKIVVAIADEKRFRIQWEAELRRSINWKRKAKMAVRAGDDELAKEALFRMKEHEALAAEFQKQWEAQKQGVDQLKTMLQTLNAKIQQAKRKKGLLLAKQKRAEAQKLISETMSNISGSSAFETFERMEETINKLEAEAEAASELNEQMTGDTLAMRFEQLESSSGVEMDLLELKEEMGLLPPAPAEEPRALEASLNVVEPIREDARESVPVTVQVPTQARAYAARG